MLTTVQAIALLTTYRYLIIFPIAFLEGPIISIICGWLVALGTLNVLSVYFLLISANLIGDLFYYALGYWGGIKLIKRFGYWFRINLEDVEKMKNYFDQHGGKIILAGKVTPHFAAGAMLAGAGLAKYRLSLFLRYSLITELIKTAIFLVIGFYLGYAYERIIVYLDYFGAALSILAVIIILIAVYFFRKSRSLR